LSSSIAKASYDDDPLSRGAWARYKPGVLTREEPHVRLAEPEGQVVFATADISQLWTSLIDGAIKSGIRAGYQIHDILSSG
jgi:monoamine oxidase